MTSPHATGADPPSRDEGTSVGGGLPNETTRSGTRHRPTWQPASSPEKDIVEEAGQGSFPGSDPPSWSGAIVR